MSDVQKVNSEENKTPAIDLTKYVSKEDFEKVQQEKERIKQEAEDAKLSLLDPDYISFLESKKETREIAKQASNISEELKEGDLSQQRVTQLEEKLRRLELTTQNVVDLLSVQDAEKRYPDFKDYRDDMVKIFETSTTPLTIEQAYKIAKANKIESNPKVEEKSQSRVSSEKPSTTVPKESLDRKNFKNKVDAGDDAWDSVIGAGKDYL